MLKFFENNLIHNIKIQQYELLKSELDEIYEKLKVRQGKTKIQ